MKNDIKAIVEEIINDNERMKREDGHDMEEKVLTEEVVLEEIMDYIEAGRNKTLPLNLIVEVRKALIKEGYSFLY